MQEFLCPQGGPGVPVEDEGVADSAHPRRLRYLRQLISYQAAGYIISRVVSE